MTEFAKAGTIVAQALGSDEVPLGPVVGPTYGDIARTMAQFAGWPRPKRRELRCHADVIEALTAPTVMPEPERALFAGPDIARMCGIEVLIDAELGPGEWRLTEDGETVESGRLRAVTAPVPPVRFEAPVSGVWVCGRCERGQCARCRDEDCACCAGNPD